MIDRRKRAQTAMDSVVQLLAATDVNSLSQQTDLLLRLQHELFHHRSLTQWHAPEDASQCIKAARVLIYQLGAFLGMNYLLVRLGCGPACAGLVVTTAAPSYRRP